MNKGDTANQVLSKVLSTLKDALQAKVQVCDFIVFDFGLVGMQILMWSMRALVIVDKSHVMVDEGKEVVHCDSVVGTKLGAELLRVDSVGTLDILCCHGFVG